MPSLAGPCGAPITPPTSYGAVTGLPPDNAIRRAVLFEMPPSMSNGNAVASGAKPEPGIDTATTLMELTIGRGAD
jgi:hypothetical protein